jgi:hypothetical protein
MYKMLMTYNLQPGKEQEAQEYLVNKLAPGLGRLGFRFSDVWFTIWGNSPQILGGGTIKDIEEAQRIFKSEAWQDLRKQMETLTIDFNLKLVKARGEEASE